MGDFPVMAAQAISGGKMAVFGALALLGACAAPPAPPLVVAAPPPRSLPALALLTAENQGYVEGLAAGERIQARHDRVRDLALQAKATLPKSPAPSPPAPPTKTAAAAPAKPNPPAATPQISYMPVGPATPVAPPAAAGSCASGFAGCD